MIKYEARIVWVWEQISSENRDSSGHYSFKKQGTEEKDKIRTLSSMGIQERRTI